MILWGWISSHRCSWMAVYVLCCNAHSNRIVVIVPCIGIVMHSLFVNCPDVIRLPRKLFIFHGKDTNLVNYEPRSILLSLFTIYYKLCFFCLLGTTIFHTIRLILCVQQDRWDWQPHCTVGAEYFDCVVQVPRCSDTGSGVTNVSCFNLELISFLLLVR